VFATAAVVVGEAASDVSLAAACSGELPSPPHAPKMAEPTNKDKTSRMVFFTMEPFVWTTVALKSWLGYNSRLGM
jgi:hypothetical protein